MLFNTINVYSCMLLIECYLMEKVNALARGQDLLGPGQAHEFWNHGVPNAVFVVPQSIAGHLGVRSYEELVERVFECPIAYPSQ